MFKCGIKKYVKELGSRRPTPGGGSASALAGALGAALIEKVCNFTIGKDKFKPVEADMRRILEDATIARKRFLQLIELDKKAFMPVAKAYKLPKDTEEQKAVRKQKIDEEMKKASVVPLEIKKICAIRNEFFMAPPQLDLIRADALSLNFSLIFLMFDKLEF